MEAAVAQLHPDRAGGAPVDLEAEASLLGALMVTDSLGAVIAEHHVESEHFYSARHGEVFRSMLAVAERGVRIDALVVSEELERRGKIAEVGGRAGVSEFASTVAVPGNVLHYAEIVVRKARWRDRLKAGQMIQMAARAEDTEALSAAEELLATDVIQSKSVFDDDAQREVLWSLLEGQAAAEFYWPFDRLNQAAAGGMRRGQVNIIAGITGDGKSQFADQVLDLNRKHGRRVCLYDNEMTVEERVARRTTRLLGVSHSQLVSGKLEDAEKKKVLDHMSTMPAWPIVEIPGWTPEEVCHHIRRNRWDLVVIDILHNFAFGDERELSAAVSSFKACAGQADCCIVLVAHVNRGVVSERGKTRPPNRHDLRWSGDIENLAHQILFVYRNRDMAVEPPEILDDGTVYFDKVRGGKVTAQLARLNGRRLRWEVRSG
jgi:replicative DNA helicase